ncbi:MAG: hypothetical protein ACK50I_15860, partial [Burkholderiales bacterium]
MTAVTATPPGGAARTGAPAPSGRARTWLGPACLIGPALVFLLVFYVAPFAQLVFESLKPTGASARTPLSALGLDQYANLFGSGRTTRALKRTLWMSAATTVITLAVSY